MRGLQGEKRVPLRLVTAVQLKEAGVSTGYLQFTTVGGNESRAGALDAVYDEYSFVFGGCMDSENESKNKQATRIRNYIERFNRSTVMWRYVEKRVTTQIKQLKSLHDAGELTDEEFSAVKAKLLN
jgi:hypothetical protein